MAGSPPEGVQASFSKCLSFGGERLLGLHRPPGVPAGGTAAGGKATPAGAIQGGVSASFTHSKGPGEREGLFAH